MRKFTIGWSMLSINLLCGLVSTLGIWGGMKFFQFTTFTLPHLLFVGLVFTGIFSIAYGAFFLMGIRPSIQLLRRMLDPQSKASAFPYLHRVRTRDLYDLANAFDSNDRYFRELAEISIQMLEEGVAQMSFSRTSDDSVSAAFQRYHRTLAILEQAFHNLARGNVYFQLAEKHEKVKVISSLRAMIVEIRQVIKKVRHEVGHIANISARVSAMTQQNSRNAELEAQAIEQITLSIHEMAENLHHVINHITVQTRTLDETFTSIEEMLSSIDIVNTTVDELSSASHEVGLSVEEIHEFMQKIEHHAQSSAEISGNVSEQAKEGLHAVAAVIEGIQTIKETVQDAAGAIERLGSESGRIGEILEVINDVAEQTNLLALNAAIIAAQAGEQGRGFSVVAEEIKELAERTRTSTKEISDIIASVQAQVKEGMNAMQSCLVAVDEGVDLANQSGDVLKTIVRGIQASRKMIATMASATVTQTENSQQLKTVVEEMNNQLTDLQVMITQQTEKNSQLTEHSRALQEITRHIEQATGVQLQESDAVVESIEHIRHLVVGRSKMTQLLAQSSVDLGKFETHLVESLGRFFVSAQSLPSTFDPTRPTVGFIAQGTLAFYELLNRGIVETLEAEDVQTIVLNSRNDVIRQAENVNWLLQQPWLEGMILGGVDEQTTSRLLLTIQERPLPFIVVDTRIANAPLSVLSDNERGGEYAAESLSDCLSPGSSVLVCGSRDINSLADRITGFLRKAQDYQWSVNEIFASNYDMEMAKTSILEGIRIFPDVKGIFLANEPMVLAYLELVREGQISPDAHYVAGFDMRPEFEEAIRDGRLLFTIAQDPVEIGRVAAQEMLKLRSNQQQDQEEDPRVILIPVKKVGKQELFAESEETNTAKPKLFA